MKRVAIFRKGDFYVYAFDLINELAKNNIDVTAVVCIDESEENVIYNDLLAQIKSIVKFRRVEDVPKKYYLKIRRWLNRLGLSSGVPIASPYLIYKTKREIN